MKPKILVDPGEYYLCYFKDTEGDIELTILEKDNNPESGIDEVNWYATGVAEGYLEEGEEIVEIGKLDLKYLESLYNDKSGSL